MMAEAFGVFVVVVLAASAAMLIWQARTIKELEDYNKSLKAENADPWKDANG